MTEPTPQEIAARVRGMAQELAEARAALHLKPGQPLGDRIRGLTEELDGRATSIEALRGDLDAVRAALSLAERKITDRAQERSAMWDVLLAVREASGAGENDDLRAVVANLRQEAALALPSRLSGLPQPVVATTDDDRIRVEIRHGDVGLEYLYDRPEAARLVHDLSLAVARLTPGGPRLGVNADPGEGATLGVCVEIAGEVLHLSPALRMEGPQLEAGARWNPDRLHKLLVALQSRLHLRPGLGRWRRLRAPPRREPAHAALLDEKVARSLPEAPSHHHRQTRPTRRRPPAGLRKHGVGSFCTQRGWMRQQNQCSFADCSGWR